MLVAMGKIHQRPPSFSGHFHIRGNKSRHLLDIVPVLVLNAVGSQGRPPEEDLLERHVPLLHGFDAVQPLHITSQIGKLLPARNMGRLDDDVTIPFVLQIGDGGQGALDIEDFLRHLGVLPRIGGILAPLLPNPPDDVRGEGQAHRDAGQFLLDLRPDVEDAGQTAFMAGAEHRQHHRLFLHRGRLDTRSATHQKQGNQTALCDIFFKRIFFSIF